ncbi:hypothetical protein [Stenotrophomonas maltophilia]|uniref:hypothetical protein n=1 Tax=Stenotrophomonas maltophilia TaxID=40324 RepID=UPI0007F92AD2|nr:hypothetical protein [Stenotrophomonas maltophilia]OBU70216.1 hypothetical protein A9J40_01735 [Stenotrophomonas maltophilia]
MAARRPLVLDASNRTRELPTDEFLAGIPLYLRVGLRAGGSVALPLSTDYTLTIGLRDGGNAVIQATVA